MDRKTARKYRSGKLPEERNSERRTWRTRTDAFEDVWPEIQELLDDSPKLEAMTLFAWLQCATNALFSNELDCRSCNGIDRIIWVVNW
jgi:hypothetical protein